MKLIIAEKKIAGERIARILSNGKYKVRYVNGIPVYFWDDFVLIPLSGHIIEHDFPDDTKNWYKIDVEELIDIKPIKYYKIPKIAYVLKKFAKKVDTVIIATDFDREGELIGMEALEIIKKYNPNVKVFRARFSAITEEEIKKAFKNLDFLDENLAKSALARRFIDLYWGVALTRILSLLGKRVKKRKVYSAGRVQTPTLALIVRREREIRNFKPEYYWKVFLDIGEIKIELDKKIKNKEELEKFKSVGQVYLENIEERVESIPAPAPYNTTSFLKDTFQYLGISTRKAMEIAEFLYMNGYISYPRTESEIYPKNMNFRKILYKLSKLENPLGKYALEILNRGIKVSRGKKKDDAHPPIHPVNSADKRKLYGKYWDVYELIVRRFFATLSGPAKMKKVRLIFKDKFGNTYTYVGKEIVEKSWIRYFPYVSIDERKVFIPNKNVFKVFKVEFKREKTKPPSRYSEGSLVKEMEKLNLGTKSTRSEIITKLFSRDYLKGRRSIKPTEYGERIVEVLEKVAPEITTPNMTAKLEKEMDAIAKGLKKMEDVVNESLEILRDVIRKIKKRSNEISQHLRNINKEERSKRK